MESSFTVYLVDSEGEWHEIAFPASLSGDHYPKLKEQVCARLGVADTELYWEDDQGSVHSISCSKALDAAIQHSQIFAEKWSDDPWLKIHTDRNSLPDLNNIKDSRNDDQTDPTLLHAGVSCDGCDMSDFTGSRYKCLRCFDLDLCHECYTTDHFEQDDQVHSREHPMQCIDIVDGSTHSFTVVACVYCDAKRLSTAEYYDHVKKYHKKQINGIKYNNEDSSFKKMLAEMWDELKERKKDLEDTERDFVERKRAIYKMEGELRAREETVRKTETALKSKESDLEDREALIKGREEALAAKEALAEKRVEAAKPLKHEMKSRNLTGTADMDDILSEKETDKEDEKTEQDRQEDNEAIKDVENIYEMHGDHARLRLFFYRCALGIGKERHENSIAYRAIKNLESFGMSDIDIKLCIILLVNKSSAGGFGQTLVELISEKTGLSNNEAICAYIGAKQKMAELGRLMQQNCACCLVDDLVQKKDEDGGIVESAKADSPVVDDPSDGNVVKVALKSAEKEKVVGIVDNVEENVSVNENDVDLVMRTTHCIRDQAVRALQRCESWSDEKRREVVKDVEQEIGMTEAAEKDNSIEDVAEQEETDYDSDASYENIDLEYGNGNENE